jgi:hypothetical protein
VAVGVGVIVGVPTARPVLMVPTVTPVPAPEGTGE